VPVRSLPERPDLAQLAALVDELIGDQRAGSRVAAARIHAHHPRWRSETRDALLRQPLARADGEQVIASEFGFADWAALAQRVAAMQRWKALEPHPRFDEALAALDVGDLARLRALLQADPELVQARGHLEPAFGYFTGATLLHHVAGNQYRGPLPANIVTVAELLLDAGADVNAETLGENGGTTMDLVITSQHASEAGVSRPLMKLLLARGARLDLATPGVLDVPLANHATAAAEAMIALGAPVDVCAAAALGRLDWLRAQFDEQGRLRARPERRGQPLAERDAIGLAMLFAYVNQHPHAVDFLLARDGNWDMIGVNNGTALHRAAGSGDLGMVQRLVALGADIHDRRNPFHATPLSWAEHFARTAVFDWMRAHCAIDLHDAICFDLPEHVAARLREAPGAVDALLDQWELPRGSALHHAARLDRVALAQQLLDAGAQPDLLAGDGRTALDLAEARGAGAVAALLSRHGGRRACEL
jgi:ankyrin repeat protein